jgi:hypothetical protein
LAKFLTPKKKSWSQPPKTDSTFWRNLEPKNKNPVTVPKVISHFGGTWSQKPKPGHSPKTDFAFWQNLKPKTKI